MKLQTPGVPRQPHSVLGHRMAQNGLALYALSELFESMEIPPARIIELGTSKGGLAIFLRLYALTVGSDVITIDHCDQRHHPEMFDMLGIDFRNQKFYENGVEDLISEPGMTVLLVDGSNKPKEFDHFAPSLKDGDHVLVHDYSPDRSGNGKNPYWKCVAITDEDTEETIEKFGLVPYQHSLMLSASWLSLRKGAADE